MSNSEDLKSIGLKATFPRLKILELFENTEIRHLTAEDVYRLLIGEGMDIGLQRFIAFSPSLNRPACWNAIISSRARPCSN